MLPANKVGEYKKTVCTKVTKNADTPVTIAAKADTDELWSANPDPANASAFADTVEDKPLAPLIIISNPITRK